MMRFAAVVLLCGLPMFAADLPADLEKALEEFDQATVRNDIPTLARLVADDYVLVNSDSSLQDKQSYLADFKVPGFKVEPYVMEQRVERLWDNTAVIGGVIHLKWTLDGKREARLLRVVHVWARRDDRWRATYTQLTRVPQ